MEEWRGLLDEAHFSFIATNLLSRNSTMLSIHVMSIGQENYYLLLAQEGYYLKGGEPKGIWCGSGAAALQLQGTVTPKACTR